MMSMEGVHKRAEREGVNIVLGPQNVDRSPSCGRFHCLSSLLSASLHSSPDHVASSLRFAVNISFLFVVLLAESTSAFCWSSLCTKQSAMIEREKRGRDCRGSPCITSYNPRCLVVTVAGPLTTTSIPMVGCEVTAHWVACLFSLLLIVLLQYSLQ
jgi:hypothetical protein